MAAIHNPQRRLVHKQFNSPLGLYSQHNVQHVLDQHIKQLDNGTIGIDFRNDPTTAVPASLQKSAVLQALEEEERQKQGHAMEARQSRSRVIDRETVLRINRRPRHRSADCAWPPRRLSPISPRPLQKRPTPTSVTSHSHQNINDIKDIFEHQSNRSEPNTLTRLLQRNGDDVSLKNKSNNKIIDNNRKEEKEKHDNDGGNHDDDEKENIIGNNNNNKNHRNTDNNRKILRSASAEKEDQKILYKNIHLWPPISSQSSQYNLNKSSQRCANDRENEQLEQIIKRHFHIIDKNYDENGRNINFHDWHGVPKEEKASNDDDGVVEEDRLTPLPPPRSSSKHIDLSRYTTLHESRSSNASPTISEFTRIYDNIVEPTAYLNISDLESIFSTNTAYSETTTQTTVETVAVPELKRTSKLYWPQQQQQQQLQSRTTTKPLVVHDHNQKYHNLAPVKQEQLIDNNRSNSNNVTMMMTTTMATTNDSNDKNNNNSSINRAKTAVSPIIPMDLVDESNIATNLNNHSSNDGRHYNNNNTRGHITVGLNATDATPATANERNQHYLLFDSNKNNENNLGGVDGRRQQHYNNNYEYDLDCQNMTNCGNENYNDDDKETTAEINKGGVVGEKGHVDMFKLAERIKGKCYTDGEYIVIPYDIFVREFGPICASSPDDNSQITEENNTDINQTNFVDAENDNQQSVVVTCVVDDSNETEQQRQQRIQSSSCQIKCANEQQLDTQQPENVQMTNIKDVIESSSHGDKITIANFARNHTNVMEDNNNNNNNRTTISTTTTSNLIKFNDDDNDCYNNFRSSDSSTATGIVKRVAWPPPPDSDQRNGTTTQQQPDENNAVIQTEQLEHHKQHYQHLDELRQQHQLQQQHQFQQQQQQQAEYAPPHATSFAPHHTHVAAPHPVDGVTFHQPHLPPSSAPPKLNPILTAELPHPPHPTHAAAPSHLKGWKPVKSPVSTLQRTPSGTYTTSVEHVTVPPPFELSTVVENSSGDTNGHHQTTTPSYQPQVTQAFRPVPPPGQGPIYKPPSPAQPRVVSQSPSNQYPGLITTLRKEAPITQQPSPVFSSQPAAAINRGGSNMRGDQKWPPTETKQQMENENEARRKLAQGPACRPKRMQKDYSQFFAKNQLSCTYPGYRAPPGTQHFGGSE